MSNEMTCPVCGSHNCWCDEKPTHMHRCLDCGYDGRSKLTTAQVDDEPCVCATGFTCLAKNHTAMTDENAFEQDTPAPDDGLYQAWSVIANARDWLLGDKQALEWQAAARRWRDEVYHPALEGNKQLPA